MTFKEYKEQVKRTLPDLSKKMLGENLVNSIHMTLGMASEDHEFMIAINKGDKTNIMEELIDKLWYLTNYININNIKCIDSIGESIDKLIYETNYLPDDIIEILKDDNDTENIISDPIFIMLIMQGLLIDMDKKELAYDKEKDRNIMFVASNNLLRSIHNYCLDEDLDLKQGMKNNILKLFVRYPDKFNTNNAVIRDLIAEREALENKNL